MKKKREKIIVEGVNKNKGLIERKELKIITDFGTGVEYAEYMTLIAFYKPSIFYAFYKKTNEYLDSKECEMSEVDKEGNRAVLETLLLVFKVVYGRSNVDAIAEEKEHKEYQESLFEYLDNHRRNQSRE